MNEKTQPSDEEASSVNLPEEESKTEAPKVLEPNFDEPAINTSEADSTTALDNQSKNNKPSKRYGIALSLLSFSVLLIIGATGFGAHWIWQEKKVLDNEIAALQKQLQANKTRAEKTAKALKTAANQRQKQYNDTEKRLGIAEQRLNSHNKRLLSMSTTSREDWLLAEAEYLLKLGNQRALIERKADSAIILLQEADNILRDMDNTDLFPLRQAIAKDLAALRLTTTIDREGIYLELAALADNIIHLPIVPTRTELMEEDGSNVNSETSTTEEKSASSSFMEQLNHGFSAFLNDLKNYIQVRQHEQLPTPILPPDSSQYVQQNIRLMIERAQLAMLREQTSIYQHSLGEAHDWLTQYYSQSAPVQKFQQVLQRLKQQNIEDQLPDISNSLNLLHAYIEKLHRLQPAETKGPKS